MADSTALINPSFLYEGAIDTPIVLTAPDAVFPAGDMTVAFEIPSDCDLSTAIVPDARGETVISYDNTLAARAVTIPPIPELRDGESINLLVTLGGHTQRIVVRGLDELTLTAADTVFDTGDLKDMYSRIHVESGDALRLTGVNPARLISAGDLIIERDLNASADGITGGPGGGRGGMVSDDQELRRGQGEGAGGPGTPGTTDRCGGSAGHESDATGSNGGEKYGWAWMPNIDAEGGSGGGAGLSVAGGVGGRGGGGGGVLELTAQHRLFIDGISLTAHGADGVAGTCDGDDCSGQGGGGSGGAIVLRSALAPDGKASVGYLGGIRPRKTPCGASEIEASIGRLRAELPNTDDYVTNPDSQGPAIAIPATGPIIDAQPGPVAFDIYTKIGLLGLWNWHYRVNGGEPTKVQLTSAERVSARDLNLVAGYNQICIDAHVDLVAPDGPDDQNCIVVAVVPTTAPLE